ncbi:hypothetical protein G4G27_05350 [Sphingomonas sp. So64.6b]|uniref:DUF5681 domain-containing protein n=1 Tax=Sphingomonas sp. So64.6b TaxID=2997354 RepID=UPI0015FFD96D|nr:DUF5681 domain-containing protein [Sphingomonas sp. So64.6b]QNA83494.1 hypothetical protein G4G27_05350 [Sphingomonas sp. So64.6b]
MTKRDLESDDEQATNCDGPENGGPENAGAVPKRHWGKPFVKGQSGNPAGRPRFRGATGRKGDRLPGSDQPTRAVILEEAYRPVVVKDGDREIEMPAHRAVFRALTEAAIGGNRMAQRQFTAIVQHAEAAQKQEQVALYETLERDGVGARYSSTKGEYVQIGSYDDEILSGLSGGVSIVRPVADGPVTDGDDA